MAHKILVVEDDLLNRMFYHEALSARGHEVCLVDDGARVMAEASRFAPDLITMDIQLPSISGLRLIRLLRRDAQLSQIPIVAITAFVGQEEEARVRGAGASAFLAKPVSMDQLVRTAETLLADSAGPRA
ncbi:response regulator [Altererythrobacter lauratis]|uniref:Response regulator n=1 Tax=Alteraurantiacibacter lauratis TaxID=2054627 RepID=A0ABV7EE92_9SPHN